MSDKMGTSRDLKLILPDLPKVLATMELRLWPNQPFACSTAAAFNTVEMFQSPSQT